MTPIALFITDPLITGRSYHLRPILGEHTAPKTAVYQGQTYHEETICYTAKGEQRTERYQYDLAQFIDAETGEIFFYEIQENL